jgi:hypothetical protein
LLIGTACIDLIIIFLESFSLNIYKTLLTGQRTYGCTIFPFQIAGINACNVVHGNQFWGVN